MKKLQQIKWSLYLPFLIIGIFTIVMFFFADSIPRSTRTLLEEISIAILLAGSLSLVVGFLGELSLGHAGFMCVGAYLGGKIALMISPVLGDGILSFIVALLAGGICAGVCGFIVGLPALRLKGDYLAITTLAFGEIVRTLFQNSSTESFGGTLGMEAPVMDSRKMLFVFGFVLVLIMLFVIQNLIRSKHGRAITAIRDNEIAARSTGINVTKYKLVVFVIAAVFAGIAGVIYAYMQRDSVRSETFTYNKSIEILVMVVIGGMGSINGSIVAATLITSLNILLLTSLPAEYAVYKNIIYAVILIIVVIYNNAPALKNFRDKYNLHNLFKRKKDDPNDSGRWDVVPTKIKMDAILSTDLVVNDYKPDKPKEEKKDE
ncbi:MAG: branched-chain amino acid ABC transporter permease [Clostridia bacterium]|nr:branched-chain amino acid ABC transporter permease [Clostridia bacterium]